MPGGSRSLNLTLSAVLAAAYVGVVYALPGISFLGFNIRIADGLRGTIPLIGWPAVRGLMLGHFIANLQSPIGLLDLLTVPVAGAGMAIAKVLSRRFLPVAFVPIWLMLTAWLAWLIGSFLGIEYWVMFTILAPQIFVSDYVLPTALAYGLRRLLPNVISRLGVR